MVSLGFTVESNRIGSESKSSTSESRDSVLEQLVSISLSPIDVMLHEAVKFVLHPIIM